jgi:hypothetical protein
MVRSPFSIYGGKRTYLSMAFLLAGSRHSIGRMSVAARLKSKRPKPRGRNRLGWGSEIAVRPGRPVKKGLKTWTLLCSPHQDCGTTDVKSFRGWRRGESNPCPRRYPRKHLHVYPTINSEEPSHAPAHCRLPSVHKIDSRTGAVAPPIRQPAVHVCRRSRRPTANVAIN